MELQVMLSCPPSLVTWRFSSRIAMESLVTSASATFRSNLEEAMSNSSNFWKLYGKTHKKTEKRSWVIVDWQGWLIVLE